MKPAKRIQLIPNWDQLKQKSTKNLPTFSKLIDPC